MIYLKLFLTFLEIGAVSFGGGYGMISIIREKVLTFGWLSEDELIHLQQYLPSVEELEISGFTDAELRAYDKFWDSVSVERTLLDDRYQKGREEGMNQRSLEIARNMLAKGMDASTVLEITGLSMEEIQ
jgi:predicted transposase/invertase (TIGR01784 family)